MSQLTPPEAVDNTSCSNLAVPEFRNEASKDYVVFIENGNQNRTPPEANEVGGDVIDNGDYEFQLVDRVNQTDHENDVEEMPLVYRKDYPIRRFGRKWRRQEVQGVFCLALEIMSLITLAIVSLHALGYQDNTKISGYLPYSFSVKILREFFTFQQTQQALQQCYFNRFNEVPKPNDLVGADNTDSDFDLLDPFASREEAPVHVHVYKTTSSSSGSNSGSNNGPPCDSKRSRHASDWLVKFFTINFLSVLTIVSASLFFLSLSVRRRKGFQAVLLLPSFVCFLINAFQQIPITFQYNYLGLVIKHDMSTAMISSASSYYKSVPILDETQTYSHCCGLDSPDSWEVLINFNGTYPGSCCNTSAFDCVGKDHIPKAQAWSVGCYQKEFERLRKFERWALFLLAFRLISEIGIFCTMSDLTRFEYPAPEATENSRVEYREYQMKCRGVARIKGVTKDGRIVVQAKCLLPWRLVPSRTDLMAGVSLHLNTEFHQTKGSVEVIKRIHGENFQSENVHIDFSRKHRGIYVFTLHR